MIKMLSAHTTEIDETDNAVNEILGQLDFTALGKNSVGLLYCHGEFVESGVAKALCERLPFDVVGMTAASLASDDFYGLYGLCLSVLTSDTETFTTAYSEPITPANYIENISNLYKEASGKRPGEKPAFVVAYLPYMNEMSGSQLSAALDQACGGIPVFGGVCYGVNMGNEKSATIFSGEARGDSLVILLVYGDVKPEFNAIALPERLTRGNRAVITDSEGCVLKKINGLPPLKYLEDSGYTVQVGAPLLVYYPGNLEPVALVIYHVFEDGSVLCGGEMPTGASIAIGEISRESVLETTEESINKIHSSEKKNGAIIFPCSVRYFALYPQHNDEMKLTSEALNGKIPYVMGYSGGELCPVPDEKGVLRNRFHNYTFCSCLF